MRDYIILNQKGDTHTKEFESDTDARHWIINHLDLSENWIFYRYAIFTRYGHTLNQLIHTGNHYKPYIN